MTETMVRVGGVDLCVETFGDADTPAILLIAGMAMSMDCWDPGLCRRLAAGGRFVIRYDHRDTGRSVSYPPGEPGYTGPDLVDDAAALIDALTDGRAHVVGLSMGGAIAQHLAIEQPDRVATLTLMSTSPGGGEDLPPPAERLEEAFADPAPGLDWTDRDAVVDYLVASERPFAGPDSFDEEYQRETSRRMAERTVNPESSAKNHWLAGGGAELRPRLGGVTAPALVMHGTEDPLFPPGHAIALSREIPGAELLWLDGIGHQTPPPSTWNLVVPAILNHTRP